MFKARNLIKLAAFASLSVSSVVFANTSSEHYENALEAFSQDKIEDAYIHLKNSLKEDPNNLPSKILMGQVLMISGYIEEAETEFVEALADGADPNLVVDPYGKTLLFLNKYEDIIAKRFRGLNNANQINWEIISASAYLNLGNIEEARKGYQKVLQLATDNIRALNALASLEMDDNRLTESQSLLDKALSISSDDTTSLRLQGELLLKQRAFDKAETFFEKGFELDPEDPLIKRSLVSVYLQQNDRIKAEILLNKVLEQTPDDPVASLINAWLLASGENNALAREELERLSSNLAGLSEERFAENPSHLYVAALAAFAQQNFESARNYFSEYLIVAPDNLDAVNLLTQTLIKLGQNKLALDVMVRHEREFASKLDSALMLGNLYLANNKSFKVLELIRRLNREYPGNKRVELLEIKTLIARDKLDEAFSRLDSSEHIKSDFSFILTKSMLLLETNQFTRALDIADKLLALAPDQIDFINYKAAVLIKMKRWQEALPYVEAVLEQTPTHFSARFNKAAILSASGNTQDALSIVEALNKERPDNLSTLIMLARVQFDVGLTDLSLQNMQRVLEKDIDNIQAHELLTTLYIRQNDLEKAQRQVSELIKILPTEPKYMLQKAELYLLRGMNDRSVRELNKIDRLLEDDSPYLLALSNLQLRSEQLEQAKSSISRAASAAPDNNFLAEQYVRLHIATNDFSAAQKKLTQLRKALPDSAQLLVLEGDLNLAMGKPEGASEIYAQALKQHPEYRLALAKYYQMTLRGVNIEQFTTDISALVEQDPDNHFQRSLLADHFVNIGDYDSALPHYELLQQHEELPNYVFIINNLANIYVERDLVKAEAFARKAVSINSELAAVLDTVGWIETLKGNHKAALDLLRRAYAKSSDDPSIRYHLAYTLHKLGRTDEAKKELQLALQAGDEFVERDKAQTLLDSI